MFVAFLAYLKFSGEIHSRTELLECWRLVGPEVAGPADSKRWTLAAPLLPTASSNQALSHGYSPGILDKMWRRYLFWCSRVRDVPSRWYIFIRMLIRLSMQDPIIKTIYLVDQLTSLSCYFIVQSIFHLLFAQEVMNNLCNLLTSPLSWGTDPNFLSEGCNHLTIKLVRTDLFGTKGTYSINARVLTVTG